MNLITPLFWTICSRLAIIAAAVLLGAGLLFPAPQNLIVMLGLGSIDVAVLVWLVFAVWREARREGGSDAQVSPGDPSKPVPLPGPIPGTPTADPPPAPHGSDFDKCLAITLKWEGGNDDDPSDSGGRTSRGITAADWNSWRQTHAGLPEDVWQAPQSEVIAIYKERYWNALWCDSLPPGVDLAVFDHGVLGGIFGSAKLLQSLVGTDQDGEIGPLTIAAAASVDPVALTGKFCDARLAHYQSLNRPKYIKGWTNRCIDVKKEALALAETAPKPNSLTLPPAANIPAPAPSGGIPPWLATMRSLIGTRAGGDNPVIMGMVGAIATKFPDLASYAATYTHDSIAWCGHSAAYCMAMAGIKPPSEYLLAVDWATWGTPVASDDDVQVGDVIVWYWSNGLHHITFYDHSVSTDDNFWCCGGNQGAAHTVTVEPIRMASRHVIRRPPVQ